MNIFCLSCLVSSIILLRFLGLSAPAFDSHTELSEASVNDAMIFARKGKRPGFSFSQEPSKPAAKPSKTVRNMAVFQEEESITTKPAFRYRELPVSQKKKKKRPGFSNIW